MSLREKVAMWMEHLKTRAATDSRWQQKQRTIQKRQQKAKGHKRQTSQTKMQTKIQTRRQTRHEGQKEQKEKRQKRQKSQRRERRGRCGVVSCGGDEIAVRRRAWEAVRVCRCVRCLQEIGEGKIKMSLFILESSFAHSKSDEKTWT